jgi:hypothetical protein
LSKVPKVNLCVAELVVGRVQRGVVYITFPDERLIVARYLNVNRVDLKFGSCQGITRTREDQMGVPGVGIDMTG